jgi:hypothetical protein
MSFFKKGLECAPFFKQPCSSETWRFFRPVQAFFPPAIRWRKAGVKNTMDNALRKAEIIETANGKTMGKTTESREIPVFLSTA